MASSQRQIPDTPRVISPSPTPSETSMTTKDNYFPPTTRSSTRGSNKRTSPVRIDEDSNESGGSESESRARSRSRSVEAGRRRRLSGFSSANSKATLASSSTSRPTRRKGSSSTATITESSPPTTPLSKTNGHLSPSSAGGFSAGLGSAYWRSLSRSPSPLGLIPIHRSWRTFIHRHEIPRKALHVSIGFLTLALYRSGAQTSAIHPPLLALLVPIAATDVLRHNVPAVNAVYIRALGAFMRESEAHDRYNGVVWYLVGTWAVMRFCAKDVGVVSILLLSWCDAAASTFGRLWGRYTPRLRRGKSVAGSAAAFVVGVGVAVLFWGVVAPTCEARGWVDDSGVYAFAFQGRLGLPPAARNLLGWKAGQGVVDGSVALGVMSVWAGLVASASELVDIFGWDDNVTIPILCGAGLWGFLKVFGSA